MACGAIMAGAGPEHRWSTRRLKSLRSHSVPVMPFSFAYIQ